MYVWCIKFQSWFNKLNIFSHRYGSSKIDMAII